MSTLTALLGGAALLLAAGLVVTVLALRREQRAHAATRARADLLEADLDAGTAGDAS